MLQIWIPFFVFSLHFDLYATVEMYKKKKN